jgi:hypothetical protein
MKKASLASLQVEMGDPPYEERKKSLILYIEPLIACNAESEYILSGM